MSPARHFTHYWANSTWTAYRVKATRGELVDFAASNVFRTRGVAPGDYIYIVTILRGALYLLTRLQVADVCDIDRAVELLGLEPENLWSADDYAIAALAAPSDFERVVPLALVEQLHFLSGGDPRPLKFRGPGELDQQTLRGVRELTPDSASLLAGLLEPLQPLELTHRQAMLDALPPVDPPLIKETGGETLYQAGALYREGAVAPLTLNVYERSARARQACLAHWGRACIVCGLEFGARYGPVAAGFIHVHHLHPLASQGGEYMLNPITDLVPICPNCHAVMHLRRDEPYSVAEVQQFLRGEW